MAASDFREDERVYHLPPSVAVCIDVTQTFNMTFLSQLVRIRHFENITLYTILYFISLRTRQHKTHTVQKIYSKFKTKHTQFIKYKTISVSKKMPKMQ